MAVLDERKEKILIAVVEDFVFSAEPVGSKRLVAEHNFNVSSATVRHELAELEEMGYLIQPHPSAGRIPSDLGYRYYVDTLRKEDVLSSEEKMSISRYYQALNYEVEELMRETTALLAKLTSYAALVFAPIVRNEKLKHLDLVWLGPRVVLMVVISSAAQVEKRVIELKYDCGRDKISEYESFLNERLVGLTAVEVGRAEIAPPVKMTDSETLKLLKKELVDLMGRDVRNRVYYNGAVNLLSHPEFGSLQMVQKLLSTLDESYQLLELLSEIAEEYRLVVKIGSENDILDIDGCSLVAAAYQAGDKAHGALGILGPTRMEYPRAMAMVRYIAENLGRTLAAIHN